MLCYRPPRGKNTKTMQIISAIVQRKGKKQKTYNTNSANKTRNKVQK